MLRVDMIGGPRRPATPLVQLSSWLPKLRSVVLAELWTLCVRRIGPAFVCRSGIVPGRHKNRSPEGSRLRCLATCYELSACRQLVLPPTPVKLHAGPIETDRPSPANCIVNATMPARLGGRATVGFGVHPTSVVDPFETVLVKSLAVRSAWRSGPYPRTRRRS